MHSRRDFLQRLSALGLGMAGLPALAPWVRPRFVADPFTLGVASGDPAPDGFVLWTRLAPDPLTGSPVGQANVDVQWEIGSDEGMQRVVRRGRSVASPDFAHAVHAEVDGLEPDRWYWYRFIVAGEASPIGRARTMPRRDARPERLRFVFASCQHYEQGYYAAHRHLAAESIDFVAFLGDYIYESNTVNPVRRHGSTEPSSLEEYRARYALYKRDADLQAAHAAFPWIVTFDDHEVDNNYVGLIPQDRVSEVDFRLRRAAAYRAYYEHMPLRRSSLPRGPDMLLYRALNFGRLASFQVLDTRQYRSDQSCGDGRRPVCDEWARTDRTVLGERQERWLDRGLSRGQATWNVLAQQIMMVPFEVDPAPVEAYNMDSWSGYPAARRRLTDMITERRVPNVVTITGDVHASYASEIPADYRTPGSPPVAVEYVGTSLTSGGNGLDAIPRVVEALGSNPWMKYHNARRGYVRCEVTPDAWHSEYRLLPAVDSRDAPIETRASFTTPAGRSVVEA